MDKYGNKTLSWSNDREELLKEVKQFFNERTDSKTVVKALQLTKNFIKYKDNNLRGKDIKAIHPDKKKIRGTGYNRKEGGGSE